MTHQPKIVIVTDPRTFDGTPYAVADRAIAQVAGLLAQALDVLPETRKMALNAELEAQLARGEDAIPNNAVVTPKLLAVEKELAALRKRLEILQRAVSFDPKHPPRA